MRMLVRFGLHVCARGGLKRQAPPLLSEQVHEPTKGSANGSIEVPGAPTGDASSISRRLR